MLNFKTTSFLFVISCVTILVLHLFFGIAWCWLVLPAFIYLIFIVTGSANISSNFYTYVFCQGKTTKKQIAITFDDGPTTFTNAILQTLSSYKVPATFFMIGKNIQGNEELVKQVISQGHTIGNHTFSHSFFIDFKNSAGFKRELQKTEEALHKITGTHLKFFRPPYGVTTPHLAKAAKELDYTIVGWNIRSLDTTKDTEDVISKRITKQIKPGAIILFHDTSDKTNAILKRTLAFVKENNYEIIKLEELLDK